MKLAVVQYASIKVLCKTINKKITFNETIAVYGCEVMGAPGRAPHQPHLFHAISMVVPVVKSNRRRGRATYKRDRGFCRGTSWEAINDIN